MPKAVNLPTRRKLTPAKPAPAARQEPSRPAIDPATLPDEYCMALDGDCLEPVIPNGAAVMLRKSESYGVGDVVAIWLKPEAVRPGAHPVLLKRITMKAPPWVKGFPYADHPESEVAAIMMVEQLNPPASYTVTCRSILAIHKAVGYSPVDVKLGEVVAPESMLPIGRKAVVW
jgi:hypothetical protein